MAWTAAALLGGVAAARGQDDLDIGGSRPPDTAPRASLPYEMSPESFRVGELTPAQMEALRAYDNRLFAVAREIRDPALRATALNRVARSKIIARKLEDADTALTEAGRAALEMPPGLMRDLRLIATTSSLVVLAHEQVVEAVPNVMTGADDAENRARRPADERDAWLARAMEEWRYAAELASHITNPNYRSEQLTKVVVGQAADALKVGRDAGASPTTRSDLEGEAPELFLFADRVLRQATGQARAIDRAVWSDQALYEVAAAAGRAGMEQHGLEIARGIPRPSPRAEALIRVAESMAREAEHVRYTLGSVLRRDAGNLLDALAAARSPGRSGGGDLPAAIEAGPLSDPANEVSLRLEELAQIAVTLRSRAREIATRAESEGRVGQRSPGRAAAGEGQAGRAQELATQAGALADALADLRGRIAPELNRARGLNPADQAAAVAKAIPAEDDPAVAAVRERVEATSRALEAMGRPMDEAATAAYTEAARSVASVPQTDLRAVSARLLADSLIAVGRFDDARRSTALIPDEGHRYVIWGVIAESQGRRGLADSAMRWIENEAPPQYRARLYRRLEEGILGTVDQIRTQTTGLPGSEGLGLGGR